MSQETSLIPHLVVHDGLAALEFYKNAFGATESFRMPANDGKRLMHAALMIGNQNLFLCDDFPEFADGKHRSPKATGTTGVTLHLCVADCDAAVEKAQKAGATVIMPPCDAFWGDRYAKMIDPFGHEWSFSTPLPPERHQAAMTEWEASPKF